ncbi:MAG TPA: VWA domain-containing protein, partial [Pyrinomonadaceae bacterium]|nr:VWA domain-containing protein [Pyrinomonadaceae bacterium]
GMRQMPGRKAVVMFSDGFSIHSNSGNSARIVEGLRRLTDLANRAAVTIYTVDARGVAVTGLTAADDLTGMTTDEMLGSVSDRSQALFHSQAGLSYLARQTGGGFIRNTNDLGMAARRALDDMRGYYLIGYRPDPSTFDPEKGRARFHNVSVKVRRSGTQVSARTGFYGFTEETARPVLRTPVEQIVAALTSPFGATDVPLKLTSVFMSEGEKQHYVNSLMHIDVSKFKFTDEPDGWRKAVIDVVALTFGERANVIDQVSRTETLRVRGETYDYILRHGLLYTMRVPVKKPGAYQLRIAVRDAASERTGSASQFIEVPDLSKDRLALSGIVMRGLTPEETGGGGASPSASSADGGRSQTTEEDTMSNAAVRQFRSGSTVIYFYQIFNAKLDRAGARPRLQTQIRLFRDGEEIHAGTPQDFDAAGQTDMKRIQSGARLRLGPNLAPGNYVLQVVVTDLLAKGDSRVATQWIDFEIVSGESSIVNRQS